MADSRLASADHFKLVRARLVVHVRFTAESLLRDKYGWVPALPGYGNVAISTTTRRIGMIPQLPPMNALVLLRTLMKRGTPGSTVAPYSSAYRLDALDPRHIARYRAALGFEAGTLPPLTYYYLVTQRAHLATLLDERFPFAIAGTVHVENDLVELAPATDGAGIDIATTVQVEAPTESGARYCVLETVAIQDGKTIFTCRSRYLARRGERRAGTASRSDDRGHAVIGSWRLGHRSGREYAAVSGDWNPIHLWRWSARLMGFDAPIIHGMHTLGKACAAIEAHTGKRIRAVSARFKAPIPLGETASIALAPDGSEFSVVCRDRIAVEGTLGFAPADSSHPKQ